MKGKIRLMLADAHPLYRAGIRSTFARYKDIVLVAEACDRDQVSGSCNEHHPDVLLLGSNLLKGPITEMILVLHSQNIRMRVLAMVDDGWGDSPFKLIGAGAAGCVSRDEEPDVLVRAVRAVMRGEVWLSRKLIDGLEQSMDPEAAQIAAPLTDRERELLKMIALGWDNTRISHELSRRSQTIRDRISRLYSKLGVSTRAEAVVWAREHTVWSTDRGGLGKVEAY